MRYILFEDQTHFDLLPLTFTRPVYELRTGIFTASERWEKVLGEKPGKLAFDYLNPKFGSQLPNKELIWINGKFCPEDEFIQLIKEIPPQTAFLNEEEEVLVAKFSSELLPNSFEGIISKEVIESFNLKIQQTNSNPLGFRHLPDLFGQNNKWLVFDFNLVTRDQVSETISDPFTSIYGKDNLFVSPGVKVKAAIINAEDGPIYLGPNVEIGEGAIIKRAHAFCENAVVGMGAKLRGDSTIGPFAKVGGEVSNSVINGYSNKGHEGYLGNSVLGYWCNLGADTNNSNLKNNYVSVRLWNYPMERFRDTGRQFCGMVMGDHSKCSINTMFNTGTVVGVSANIFGSGFPRNFVPSFSWGGSKGMRTYLPRKAYEVAEIVLGRKGKIFDETEKAILDEVFKRTGKYRGWERPKITK